MPELLHTPTGAVRYTSYFGERAGALHRGVDIGASSPGVCGDELYATADGTVRVVRPAEPSYGNYLVIEHDGWCDLYAHMQDFFVDAGQSVSAGDVVGHMGSTGNSTGAHLHYEIRDCPYSRFWVNGTVAGFAGPEYLIDPKPYIDAAVSAGKEALIMNDNNISAGQDNIPSEWSGEAVVWAEENGILYGDESGNYKLRDTCTREQLLVFLHRLYKLLTES